MPIALRHLARRRGLGCLDGDRPAGAKPYEPPSGARMALPREVVITKPWQHFQGGTNACAGHGPAHAIANGIYRRTGQVVKPSPMALYALARIRHGALLRDEGTYLASVAESLLQDGFATLDHWPWAPVTKLNVAPSRSALGLAARRAGIEVRWLVSSGDALLRDMQLAIANGDCVVVGRTIDQVYSRGLTTLDEALPATDPLRALGGHCTTFRGYRMTSFGIEFRDENSWRGWGVDGDCYVSEAHAAGVRQAFVIPTGGIS